jgi:hypothetical protein
MRTGFLLGAAPLQAEGAKLKQYVSLAGICRQRGYFGGLF